MRTKFQVFLFCIFISASAFAQNSSDIKIVELNSDGFKQKVWNYESNQSFNRIGKLPIILDFHATWCRPCKMLAPHLQTIQNKYNGKLIVYKIDVDKEPELARKFKVEAMPTIIFINSKTSYKSELGYKDLPQFEDLVKQYFFKK